MSPALAGGCFTTEPPWISTGGSIPLFCLEGVPAFPGAPQDEAGLTRKFETSHVALRAGVTQRGDEKEADRREWV